MNIRNAITALHNIPMNLVGDMFAYADQEDLENIALHSGTARFARTFNIERKEAKAIQAQIKHLSQKAEKKERLPLERYSMREFRAQSFLDETDKEYLNKYSHGKNAQEMRSALASWGQRIEALVNQPIIITDDVDFVSQPESMMSRIIGVKYDGQPTDMVAICDHQVVISTVFDEETLKELQLTDQDIKYIRDKAKDIAKSYVKRLVHSGIVYNNTHFVFFTAAPSQLKKGSCYLMREEEYNAHKIVWWGGLTPRIINEKGGIVTTKFLQQFRALLCTAAAPSSNVFGKALTLDNVVCVPEYTTKLASNNVWRIDANYNLTETVMNDIDHSPFDGAGMIVREVAEKVLGTEIANELGCEQFRAFSCKGLLITMRAIAYNQMKGYNNVLEDIDHNQVDIVKENKFIIINDTIFKLYKYYGSWTNYVETMRKLGLMELYICGRDEEAEKNSALSRQSLQSLFCATNEELETISRKAVSKLQRLNSLNGIYDLLSEAGVEWDSKSKLGKLVSVYPDILAMPEVVQTAKERYDSAYNKIMYGKLPIKGEFHYASPDLGAYCDVLFGHKDLSDPDVGILKPYEVAVNNHYKPNKETWVSLVRYPHAFHEWINTKVVHNEFFDTNACYFSVHDLTYRTLQMDVDGDHVLVVEDKTIKEIVDRIHD